MKSIRNGLWVAVLAVLFNVAYAQQSMTVNIDSQPLVDALNQFANQTGLQVLVNTDEVQASKLMAPRVSGMLTADDALRQLLSGSELKYEFINERTVRVSKAKTAGDARASGERTLGDGMRLARTEGQEGAHSGSSAAATAPEASSDRQKADSDSKIEEIVVTAQKRAERLQDVPISVSVLSGKQLDNFTGGNVRDALRTVPSVTFSKAVFGDAALLSIRGVAPILATANTVGYYMDGVPFGFVSWPFAPDPNVYDLERIEVLRGPQGTLYGASSLNGVVRVLTHEADLNEFQLKGRTSISSTQGGDENHRVDGAINVPIVEGKLAARAAVSYADEGGWIDSLVRQNINDSENLDARLKLRAQPTDALSIGLSYWQSRRDTGAQSLADPNDFYPGTLVSNGNIDFDVYGGEIAYDFPGFTMSSTTSRIEYSSFTQTDSTAFANVFAGSQNYFQRTLDAEVFSEELLLRSSKDSRWRWSLGAFYRDAKDRDYLRCNPACYVGLPDGFVFFDPRGKSESYAVFGEATKRLMDGGLELTGGLRYFHDHVTGSEGVDPSYHPSANFKHVSPRAVLTWHANQDQTLYVSYSQGFRSGVNQPEATLQAAPQFKPVEPDKLLNYEIGAKGALGNGLLVYEAAVYYMDWKDTQQYLSVFYGNRGGAILTPAIVNVGSASGLGAELALTLRPTDGLSLTGSLGVNDLTFDSPLTDGTTVLFEKGSRPNWSSKYTAAASASYTRPLGGSGLAGTVSVSGNYASKLPERFLLGNTVGFSKLDPFFSMQGSVTVGAADRWSVQLFGDNLTNNRALVQGDIGSFFGTDIYGRRVRPRTIGVQFEFSY